MNNHYRNIICILVVVIGLLCWLMLEQSKKMVTLRAEYDLTYSGYSYLFEAVSHKNNVIAEQRQLIDSQNEHLKKLLPLAFDQVEREQHVDQAFLTDTRSELLYKILDCVPELDKKNLTVMKTKEGFEITLTEK